MRLAWWLVPLFSLTSCKDPALNVDGERVPSRSPDVPVATAAPTAAPPPATAAPAAAPKRPKNEPIVWDERVAWKTWQEGSKLAQSQKKPIFLLVYADWCPHCRSLKAVFDDPEVRKLADGLVMVRQDADADDAAWLSQKVGSYGSYVPRIFFLDAEGVVKPELNSGNQRFPYFYTPEGVAALKASMRRAAGGLSNAPTAAPGGPPGRGALANT